MSWLRIDDKFARHPKIQTLTDREFRIWIGVLCYCAEYRNQGHVHKQTLCRSVNGVTPAVLRRFAAIGLLDEAIGGNGLTNDHYQVHDFHIYNKDGEAAERMRRNREQNPRVSGERWERTRNEVFARDDGICADCGKDCKQYDGSDGRDVWNADHEPPRAVLEAGGISVYDPDYIVTRCHSCHAKKTRREANKNRTNSEPHTEPREGDGSSRVRPPRVRAHARVPVPSPSITPTSTVDVANAASGCPVCQAPLKYLPGTLEPVPLVQMPQRIADHLEIVHDYEPDAALERAQTHLRGEAA